MKYLIYARVSPRGSDSDRETSIKMQLDLCREYVLSQGGEIVSAVSDEFYSGKDMSRPAWSQVMAELDSGAAEWETICCYKLSRMTRSLRDGAVIFDKLYRHAKGFVSITEKNLDFSTPSGRAMLGILQVFNQFEREQTAENTRNKMISIAAAGLWPCGNPPYGYRRATKGDNQIYVDPRRSEIVRDIFAMYAADNYTTMHIVQKYRGVLSKQQILNLLRNKTYLGRIVYAGQEFPGRHPAIIDETLWQRVQTKLPCAKRHSRPKAQRYPYVLSGLVKCHCGRYMTPASAKSGEYHYYRCTDNITCKNRISAPLLEKSALDYCRKITIPDKLIEASCAAVEKKHLAYVATLSPELLNVRQALKETRAEREKVYQTILGRKLTDDNAEFFNTRLAALSKEIDRLNARMEYLDAQCCADAGIFDSAREIVNQLHEFSKQLSMEPDNTDNQRRLLLANVKGIQQSTTGDFRLELNFKTKSSPNGIKWLRQLDSNQRPSG